MFVQARISLLAILFILAHGEDEMQVAKKIHDTIKRTVHDMRPIMNYAAGTRMGSPRSETKSFKEVLERNDEFVDFGQRFIVNLTDFGGNLTMINHQVIV